MRYVNYKMIDKMKRDPGKSSELYNKDHQTIKGGSMNEQQQMEVRLWDYIDGLSGENEKSAIEKLIAANTEWKSKFEELKGIHQLMNASELEEPSLRFTKNVMEHIAKFQVAPATRSYINKKIIVGIFGFFGLMMLGFIIYGFAQLHFTNTGSNDIIAQYDISRKFDFGKLFNNAYTNIFLLINVVLGLVLTDMYLQRKKDKAGVWKS